MTIQKAGCDLTSLRSGIPGSQRGQIFNHPIQNNKNQGAMRLLSPDVTETLGTVRLSVAAGRDGVGGSGISKRAPPILREIKSSFPIFGGLSPDRGKSQNARLANRMRFAICDFSKSYGRPDEKGLYGSQRGAIFGSTLWIVRRLTFERD